MYRGRHSDRAPAGAQASTLTLEQQAAQERLLEQIDDCRESGGAVYLSAALLRRLLERRCSQKGAEAKCGAPAEGHRPVPRRTDDEVDDEVDWRHGTPASKQIDALVVSLRRGARLAVNAADLIERLRDAMRARDAITFGVRHGERARPLEAVPGGAQGPLEAVPGGAQGTGRLPSPECPAETHSPASVLMDERSSA